MYLEEPKNQTRHRKVSVAAIVIAIQPAVLRRARQYSFDALRVADTTGKPLPKFSLHSSAHPPFSRAPREAVSQYRGFDLKVGNRFRSEFVAIGAHYDHLGTSNGKIYYGADDDGSVR